MRRGGKDSSLCPPFPVYYVDKTMAIGELLDNHMPTACRKS